MRLDLKIYKSELKKIKAFYEAHSKNELVKARISRKVKNEYFKSSRAIFWKGMIPCLITSQLSSGPGSAEDRFTSSGSFPLNFSKYKSSNNLKKLVSLVISENGLRWSKQDRRKGII